MEDWKIGELEEKTSEDWRMEAIVARKYEPNDEKRPALIHSSGKIRAKRRKQALLDAILGIEHELDDVFRARAVENTSLKL